MIGLYKDDVNALDSAPKFTGDIRCAGHVMNLATSAFLRYTSFKPNTLRKFKDYLKRFEAENPHMARFIKEGERTAEKVRCIVKGVRNNQFLGNTFRIIVQERKSRDSNSQGPENLLSQNDTRWLSTQKMLQRFILFRAEISELLRRASMLPKTKRDNLKINSFEITDVEWNYIILIRDILDAFSVPTMMLQASNSETSNLTVPLMFKLLAKLETWKVQDLLSLIGYLTLGINDACDKLLYYYPLRSRSMESMKDLYLATVLDPRLKLAWFIENNFPHEVVDAIRTYFYEVYYRYEEEVSSEDRRKRQRNETEPVSTNILNQDFNIFLESNMGVLTDELTLYISEGRARSQETVKKFYHNRRDSFPIIYRIAKDYLSIMAMSAPSESLFSQVKDIVTDKRNRLLPSMIKILAVLKSRKIVQTEKSTSFDDWEDYATGSAADSVSEMVSAFNSYDEEIAGLAQGLENCDLLDNEEDTLQMVDLD